MTQGEILVAVLIGLVLLIAIGIWLTMRQRRTATLRARYGDEYDRTLAQAGGRDAAEANLIEREKRVAALDIRPLAAQERDEFASEWRKVKSVFVDSPAEAVLHADRMLTKMLQLRGFPMTDFDRRYEDLSVNYPDTARHYRAGNAIAERQNRGEATTEELRQAMKHYETLFEDMAADVSEPAARPLTRAATPSAPV